MSDGRIINLRIELDALAMDMAAEALRRKSMAERVMSPEREIMYSTACWLARYSEQLVALLNKYAETLAGVEK